MRLAVGPVGSVVPSQLSWNCYFGSCTGCCCFGSYSDRGCFGKDSFGCYSYTVGFGLVADWVGNCIDRHS